MVVAGGLLLLFGFAPVAEAHNPITSEGEERIASGIAALGLIVIWALYAIGARRTPIAGWRMWLFHGTAVLSFFTLLGPLDDWAETSASAHMTQHMLMMVVIGPLFVLARPLPQLLVVGATWVRSMWRKSFKITQYPMICAYLHGFMIWFWHVPAFYMLAVENPWVHIFEHACFLVTAVWFWWSCLYAARDKAPFAFLALLFTLMHTGFLGALLTFAAEPLYGEARDLQDQQLAGLLMWVLGGIPYIAASIWAGVRWYRQLDRNILSD